MLKAATRFRGFNVNVSNSGAKHAQGITSYENEFGITSISSWFLQLQKAIYLCFDTRLLSLSDLKNPRVALHSGLSREPQPNS